MPPRRRVIVRAEPSASATVGESVVLTAHVSERNRPIDVSVVFAVKEPEKVTVERLNGTQARFTLLAPGYVNVDATTTEGARTTGTLRLTAKPAPVEPAPVEPAPVEPAPVEPAPAPPSVRVTSIDLQTTQPGYALGDRFNLDVDFYDHAGVKVTDPLLVESLWKHLSFRSLNEAVCAVRSAYFEVVAHGVTRLEATLAPNPLSPLGAIDGEQVSALAPQPEPGPIVVPDVQPVPPNAKLTAAQQRYLHIDGLTEARVRAISPAHAAVLDRFNAHVGQHLAADPRWEAGYYDRGRALLEMAQVQQRDDYLAQGGEQVARYATGYVIASNSVSGHWFMDRGIGARALAGDVDAARAVAIAVASFFNGPYYVNGVLRTGEESHEARLFGRLLEACILGDTFKLRGLDVANWTSWVPELALAHDGDYAGMARFLVERSMRHVNAEGSMATSGQDGLDKFFYTALYLFALLRAVEHFRLPVDGVKQTVFRALDFMWARGWKGNGFSYLDGQTSIVGDLTLMHAAPFYGAARWVSPEMPFASRFRDRGDQIVAAGVRSASWDLPWNKQFNQAVHSFLVGCAWRPA